MLTLARLEWIVAKRKGEAMPTIEVIKPEALKPEALKPEALKPEVIKPEVINQM